jgi:hypothetical protein
MFAPGMTHSVSRSRKLLPEFSAFGNSQADKTPPLAIRPTTYSGIWNLPPSLNGLAAMQVPTSASEFQEARRILAEDPLALRARHIDLFKQL